MSAPAPVSFDARPLVDAVDRRAVSEWAKRTGASSFAATNVVAVVIFAVVGLFVAGVFVSVFAGVIGSLLSSTTGMGFGAVGALIPVILFGGIIVVGVVLAVRGVAAGRTRAYRLAHFAQANGMGYTPSFDDPGLPGMIFGRGSSRRSSDLVRGDRPRFVEFANYRYTTGSGKNRTTHRWGYVAVKLDVPLPHIVLDATSNNGLFGSNLPLTLDREQRLSLEGDFDRYFTLYCPSGYERDALYLFTPDIMARFIDNAAALDVEIVDDWLFLYGKRDFSTLDPATWAWLFSVVRALLDKLAQWARWRDERLEAASLGAPVAQQTGQDAVPFTAPTAPLRPPPGVAPQGRRLRGGVPWAAIVVIAGFVLFWIVSQSGFGVFSWFLNR